MDNNELITLSLCPTCYKKIPARIAMQDGEVVMNKSCDIHGPFSSVVEKDIQHFSNFYQFGTLGNNNTIIIHIHNQCNMKCSWCYYPMDKEKMHDFDYYNSLLRYPYGKFNLLFSGGEPTERPDYFDFTKKAFINGWNTASITNMINIGDPAFFKDTMNPMFVQDGVYKFAMSMMHPKNYSEDILKKKMNALENIEKADLQAMCVMFSIQSLDELDYIRDFYDKTKHLYTMLRIRTMFRNWKNKNDNNQIYLSELHKAFLDKFGDLIPVQSQMVEKSNIYCLYMQMDEGINVSLSSAPTVENVDYHLTLRPVFMLALDNKCYPVPLAQIINEGIDSGWHNGYQIREEV